MAAVFDSLCRRCALQVSRSGSGAIRQLQPRRASSTAAAAATKDVAQQDMKELEEDSQFMYNSTEDSPAVFDPAKNARRRRKQLPPSRYQYRPPKYYRGPLHPNQPPRPSDPASREFIPGPFSLPRLQQTYESTIAQDLMVLSYQHFPPGTKPPPKGERLRSWDGSSPYHKNRPLRAPRGSNQLDLVRKPVTFRNIPELEGVTVHSFVKEAVESSAPLHIASMAIQAITGARCTTHAAKTPVPNWDLKKGKFVAVTSELWGEDAYHFVSKLIDVVMPRIRDWKGIKGTSGDANGNITFGMKPDIVALFPEIEVNYDAYPPKLIPGCHISIKTSAKDDRDARMLLMAMGIPFYGKFPH